MTRQTIITTCRLCGTEFPTNTVSAKYCPSCRRRVQYLKQRRRIEVKRNGFMALQSVPIRQSLVSQPGPSNNNCFGCPLQGWECRSMNKPPCDSQAASYLAAMKQVETEDLYA